MRTASVRSGNYMAERTVSEPSLSLGAAQLATLVDSSRELVAILGQDGTILFANATFRNALGYKAEDLLGRSLHAIVHPQDAERLRERLKEVASRPAGAITERCRIRNRDASWRWIQATLRNRLGEPGLEGILLHALDVTDLHRMEAERQVISDVVHALNQTSNLDQLLSGIHQALKRILAAENCFVALHEPVSDTFEFPFFADQFDSAPTPQKVDRSCTAYVFRTGRAKLIPQSDFDRLAELGEVELVGSPSPAWLGVPLRTPTATIGVLVVQSYHNENAYDLRDLEFLDSVGGHIALAIERRRSEDEVRRNESILRLLFEHSPMPTWLYEVETLKFLNVNQAAIQQYGFSAMEFAEMTILDIRPESERERIREYVKACGWWWRRTSVREDNWKGNCGKRRRWKRWAGSRAEWRTTSTIC